MLGSYFSFYNPKVLSKNIEEISSNKLKQIASLVSVTSITLLFFFFNPKTNLEWLEYGFIIIFYFISVIDLYSKIIPNRGLIFLLVIGIFYYFVTPDLELLLAGGSLFVFLMIINFLVHKILRKVLFGWGDVKLISVLALVLGWEVLWVIYIAIIFGGVFSMVGIAFKKITSKSRIPLAFFFLIGLLILKSSLFTFFYFHLINLVP